MLLRILWRNLALILIVFGVGMLLIVVMQTVFSSDMLPPPNPSPSVAKEYAARVAESRRATAPLVLAGRLLLGSGIALGTIQSVVSLFRSVRR